MQIIITEYIIPLLTIFLPLISGIIALRTDTKNRKSSRDERTFRESFDIYTKLFKATKSTEYSSKIFAEIKGQIPTKKEMFVHPEIVETVELLGELRQASRIYLFIKKKESKSIKRKEKKEYLALRNMITNELNYSRRQLGYKTNEIVPWLICRYGRMNFFLGTLAISSITVLWVAIYLYIYFYFSMLTGMVVFIVPTVIFCLYMKMEGKRKSGWRYWVKFVRNSNRAVIRLVPKRKI